MRNAKNYLILIATLLLSGCSLLSPVQTEPAATYVLNTIPNHIPARSSHHAILLVSQPDTPPIYNTTQMAYTTKPYQVAFFGHNQWAETPSQMLLPLIIQSLQKTHYFRAVVTPPYVGEYNYLLATQILQLQQNFVRQPNVVEFSLRAQLIKMRSNQIIASKEFTVALPIRQKTPYGGVIATNRATGIILAELTNFCLQHTS
jgi:cholesterol transport system auxiliary component